MDNFDSFKDYMDKIEADAELKENTEKYIKEALAKGMRQGAGRNPGKTFIQTLISKRILIPACLFAAFALMTISGYAYYVTPVNYISLDINPSIELGVNAFDTVVSARGINADGKNLIKGKELTFMSVNESVNKIVTEAAEQNYIKKDGTTVIAVTAESDDQKDITNLQHDCVKGIIAALDEKNTDAVILKDSTNPDIRDDAENLNISPGKLNLINYLQKLDPGVTVDQYRNSSVTEIVNDANDLLTDDNNSNDQIVKNDDTTDEILKAGEQLEDAQDNSLKNNETDQNDHSNSTVDNSDNQDQTNSSSDQNSKDHNQTNDNTSSQNSDNPQNNINDIDSSGQ